jgi:t-SNARE complex subunit (syntaxin)
MIDNIENNMMNTVQYVETAKEETQKAVVYKKKARRVRIEIILSLFVY